MKISPSFAMILLLAAAFGTFTAAWWLRSKGLSIFLPFWHDSLNPYAVFSSGHLIDLLNMICLLSPAAVIMLVTFDPKPGNDKKRSYLLIASAVLFLGMSVVDIVLEAADWDLFSFSLIPLFLFAFETASRQELGRQPARYVGVALALISFHTLPWIFSNTREDLFVKQYSLIAARCSHADRPKMFARATMALTMDPLKNNDAAIYLGIEAVNKGMADQRIWNNLGLAYYGQGQFARSIEAYKKVTGLDPSNANAWGMLGTIYAHKEVYDSAAVAFGKTVRSRPEDNESWFLWADAMMKKGNLFDAVLISREALARWPTNGKLWAIQSACLIQMGSPDAFYAAERSLEYLPGDPASYINAGIAHAVAKDYSVAKEIWIKGTAIFPDNKKLRVLSGLTENEIIKEFNKSK